MTRQKTRKLLLVISFLLFPITLYYFSPALIINAGLKGIINGSFIIFVLQFLLSIPFGRVFCGYICPGGGIQECAFLINSKTPKQGWKNYIKYGIWLIWVTILITVYIRTGKINYIDFFYETEKGVSIKNIYGFIIYYGIVFIIIMPSIVFGKRVFCHYFCWMAPFMVIGAQVRKILHLPGLQIIVDNKKCISCGKCNLNCPMGLNVKEMVKNKDIKSMECIQCGACVDECPQKILKYSMN